MALVVVDLKDHLVPIIPLPWAGLSPISRFIYICIYIHPMFTIYGYLVLNLRPRFKNYQNSF